MSNNLELCSDGDVRKTNPNATSPLGQFSHLGQRNHFGDANKRLRSGLDAQKAMCDHAPARAVIQAKLDRVREGRIAGNDEPTNAQLRSKTHMRHLKRMRKIAAGHA